MKGQPAVRKSGSVGGGAKRGNGSWPPLQPGHTLTRTHGAYSTLAITEKAQPIADELRDLAPAGLGSDEAALQLAAGAFAQVQLALAELERVSKDPKSSRADRLRLSEDARGWHRVALHALDRLGLTPAGRVAIGLQAAQAGAAQARGAADLSRLDDGDLARLRDLLAKAEGASA